jgi:hypothetical protein
MNRVAIGTFVLLSFIAIAVFGVLAMSRGDGAHMHGGCIGATAAGAVCPEGSPLDFIAFHFRAFLRFSTGVPLGALLVAIVLVAVAFVTRQTFPLLSPMFVTSISFTASGGDELVPVVSRLRSFLVLHERLDTAALS